ncbi:MAG: helix-turn-helix domain-containing protein [Alistipes sp.]|nr:helix-turn-helix domain-containing protein [Alistipes sp.]
MLYYTRLLFLFFCTLTIWDLGANSLKEVPFPYSVQRITPESGVTYDGIRDAIQDSQGFVWILSDNDLFRFDGYTFKRYTNVILSLDQISNLSFFCLEIDSRDCLYIGMKDGVVCYDTRFDKVKMMSPLAARTLIFDGTDCLWMLGDEVGYYVLSEERYVSVNDSDGQTIRNSYAACFDRQHVYIGTSDGLIYKYGNGSVGQFPPPSLVQLHNIVDMACGGDELYVLTEERGLHILNKESGKEVACYDFFNINNQHMPAKSILIDRLNRIWIATQRGIYLIDRTDQTYSLLNNADDKNQHLISSSVWKIEEDQQGNLWFGTYSGGLYFIDCNGKEPFYTYREGNNQLNCPVVSSIVAQDNVLWVGTEGKGVNRLDMDSGKFTYLMHDPSKNSLSYDNIKSLVLADDQLWIASFRGGLDRYDIQKNRFVNFNAFDPSHPLLENHIRKIVKDGQDGFWMSYVSVLSAFTYYSHKTREFTHIKFPSDNRDLIGRGISDMAYMQGDILWIATDKNIYTYNKKTGEISNIVVDPDSDRMPGNISVKCIACDVDSSILWIGTNAGELWKYDSRNHKMAFCADLSLYNAYSINSIICDKAGRVWMGSDNGLFNYNEEADKLLWFNKSDGVQGNMFYLFAATMSSTGELYFGGNEGLSRVNPDHITAEESVPEIIFTDFSIDGQSVAPTDRHSPLRKNISVTDSIVLNYTQCNIGMEFSSNSYVAQKKNLYRYQLKGYDDRQIVMPASQRSVSYTKLKWGSYIFEISASNNDGDWGPAKSLYIRIRPPWWYSTVAVICYFILGGVLLAAIVRYQDNKRKIQLRQHAEEIERQQKEAKHREQQLFFTNVSHDFRTPLSLMLAAIDSMDSALRNNQYVKVMERSVKRLMNMVNELMDFLIIQNSKMSLRLKTGDWNGFIGERCGDFMGLAKQKGLEFTVNLCGNMPKELVFDEVISEKILFNLLYNAFNYTVEGGVSVETILVDGAYVPKYKSYITIESDNIPSGAPVFGVVISDTGVGISEKSIADVFERYFRISDDIEQHIGSGIGLALVKSLVELHGGRLILSSERKVGTEICVMFPVHAQTGPADADTPPVQSRRDNAMYMVDSDMDENRSEEPAAIIAGNSKKTVMLVEDNSGLKDMLGAFLAEEYRVIACSNGLDAINMMEATMPDVVVTDIMMPIKNGITLCKEIKENFLTSHIPVIMLTAKVGEENQIEGMKVGVDAYINKPVSKELLLLSVNNLIQHKEQLRKFYLKNIISDVNFENTKDQKFMDAVSECIQQNITDSSFDVAMLAANLCVSRSNLYNKIKVLTGVSPVEFLRKFRINKAARMLIDTDMSISQIIECVGIESASYFSKVFKQEFGETPSEYQKRRRG